MYIKNSEQSSLSYAACDLITRHIITMLLSISDWTSKLAKHITENTELGEGHNERCVRFSNIFLAIDVQSALSEMSSVASKHALLIALGGFSIAALFVWYINKNDKEGRKKKKTNDLVTNGTMKTVSENGNLKTSHNGHTNRVQSSISSSKLENEGKENNEFGNVSDVVQNEETPTEQQKQRELHIESTIEQATTEKEVDGHYFKVDSEGCVKQREETVEFQSVNQNETVEKEVTDSEQTIDQSEKQEKIEESFVKREEPKLRSAPTPSLTMPSKKKVTDHEQIPEEPTPTKANDVTSPLSLDIVAQMSPASFSWSEEMEKSYIEDEFRLNESSDIDRSPASPLKHIQNQQQIKKGGQKNNRKGGRVSGRDHHHQHHQQRPTLQLQKKEDHVHAKKGQKRLTKEKSADETQEKSQKRVVLKHQENESGDAAHNQAIEPLSHHEDESYEKSDSPGLASQNSEASSQDSGRATGPLASPHDEGLTTAEDDFLPMYEFEIPNSLVGLIIGVKGKTIKELSLRTNVRMLIRQHHATDKVNTHQICQVRGKRDEINHCLQMLRRRFPPARFPELNLQPVVPPVLPNSNFDMLSTQPTWLTLPEEIKCEVAVSSIISASHFFVQQPTHPSFASLRHLDMYMGTLYGEQSNLPELPIPCQNGLLCAAPVGNSWFRAVTVQYFEDTDEVFVKFVDYGGYTKMARQDLRQIRTDLMSLPFQSTEVMLAHVRPVDGTTAWSDAAMQKFRDMCTGKVINCKLVGYSADTRIPMVELYLTLKEGVEVHEIRFDQVLMDSGLARTADPSKMSRLSYPVNVAIEGETRCKRPSFSSQTAAVC